MLKLCSSLQKPETLPRSSFVLHKKKKRNPHATQQTKFFPTNESPRVNHSHPHIQHQRFTTPPSICYEQVYPMQLRVPVSKKALGNFNRFNGGLFHGSFIYERAPMNSHLLFLSSQGIRLEDKQSVEEAIWRGSYFLF